MKKMLMLGMVTAIALLQVGFVDAFASSTTKVDARIKAPQTLNVNVGDGAGDVTIVLTAEQRQAIEQKIKASSQASASLQLPGM